VSLKATAGNLTLNKDVSLGTGNFTVSSSISTTQTATGNVSAAGLEIQGAGNTTLTNTANDVATIAGNTSGTVKYVDANDLAVGTVTSTGFSGPAANVAL
jgi:hypothetical protein